MAEHKYDLALINTESGTKIREKPWYDFKNLHVYLLWFKVNYVNKVHQNMTVVVKIRVKNVRRCQ